MTTALLEADWSATTAVRDDESVASPRRDPLETAYVISGAMEPSGMISGATLDYSSQDVNRLSIEPGAIAVTIADDLVLQQSSELHPVDTIAVGAWMGVAAERIGNANASLIGSRIRKILGPIPTLHRLDVGATCLGDLQRSRRRIITWTDRAGCALREDSEPWSVSPAGPATARGAAIPTDSQANATWLKANTNNFIGQWVALKNGRLLAADPSRAELTAKLRANGQLAGAFLVSLKN